MHLLNSYSLQAGQEIKKPHVYPKYFPLIADKFIVIQPWSKQSKNYNNWDEVSDLITPILHKNGIKIVQVGAKDEKPIKNALCTQGNTSWGQLEYIISKSMLTLSTDSISSHLAGYFNVPLVCLISNNYSECVKPYFGDKSKQIILEPDRTKRNPMFALDEGPIKQIDEIKPEDIASAVLKLLNLEFNYNYNTVKIGNMYHNKIIESAVTDVIDVRRLGVDTIILRMDWNNDLEILKKQLSLNKCQIITDQEIPEDILISFKHNIVGIIYKINHKNNPEFIRKVIKNKIGYQLISELNELELNEIKLNYLDFGVINRIDTSKYDLNTEDYKYIYYKSSKLVLANGKFYPCYQAFINKAEFNPMNIVPLPIDTRNIDLLWKEKDFLYFLKKVDKI